MMNEKMRLGRKETGDRRMTSEQKLCRPVADGKIRHDRPRWTAYERRKFAEAVSIAVSTGQREDMWPLPDMFVKVHYLRVQRAVDAVPLMLR